MGWMDVGALQSFGFQEMRLQEDGILADTATVSSRL